VRATLLLIVLETACGSSTPAPDAAPPWTAGPELPSARLESGVTALGTRLIVADGFDPTIKIVNEVDALDTATDQWSRLPDAPVAWTHLDLAAANGSLYLLGGLEGQDYVANGATYVLDSTQTAWTPLMPQPAGLERGAAGVVVRPPMIYLIGGAQQNTSLASVLAYDIANDSWARLPDLPSPRSHPAAAILDDGTLIVAGGLGTLDSTQPLAETLALPINATSWQARAPMPTARGGCAYALFGAQLICAGGEANGSALAVTEAYDWAHDTWTTLAPMPLPRAGTRGAKLGTRFFVPGGAHHIQFVPLSTTDVLTVE